MGCDIHDYVEVRKNGVWEKVGNIFPYPYHHADEPSDVLRCYATKEDGGTAFIDNYHPDHNQPCNSDCYVDNPRLCDNPYRRRNYDLFGMLANVRNSRGFAGTDTGDGFVPIAMPRGLPSDVSNEVRKLSDDYGDGHSHSYLTVAELEAYDWNQVTKHRGWVDPWQFEVWRREGAPQTWCGGVSGRDIAHISNVEMARLIDSGDIQWAGPEPDANSFDHRAYTTSLSRSIQSWDVKPGTVGAALAAKGLYSSQHYTLVEWQRPYSWSAQKFLDETMPRLRQLGKPEDVRMVFWFDN